MILWTFFLCFTITAKNGWAVGSSVIINIVSYHHTVDFFLDNLLHYCSTIFSLLATTNHHHNSIWRNVWKSQIYAIKNHTHEHATLTNVFAYFFLLRIKPLKMWVMCIFNFYYNCYFPHSTFASIQFIHTHIFLTLEKVSKMKMVALLLPKSKAIIKLKNISRTVVLCATQPKKCEFVLGYRNLGILRFTWL